MRWRRWNFPVTGSGTDSGTHADANSDTHTDANSDTRTDADTHTNAITNAERWDDDHHHVSGRVTPDADRAGGNPRDVREQRRPDS